ncbi:hypothetical protein AURDEDRAFT_178502 [Auricularia subglabra TFB-10046 SS5]|uniref:Uncharacterized protein n=1 Tax=Auricularia subglabra (strain TFB-10046 / SS5) TaxID=717982 RepID=J0CQG8_AURST|nr:hypothetical protein AURDEDRAFT_178502 [Auricularia subglabra TFB-10046 SS5]
MLVSSVVLRLHHEASRLFLLPSSRTTPAAVPPTPSTVKTAVVKGADATSSIRQRLGG